MAKNKELGFDTLAVRSGQHRSGEQEHAEPIFTSSSFVFANAAEAAARFGGEEAGNVYSRFTNPTVRTFEERLAALEGGERCVATASGMSAILSTVLGLLRQGDHVISSHSVFGSTVQMFSNILPRFGIEVTFVPPTDYRAWESAVKPTTKLFFLETPSNPLMEITDIGRVAELAHANKAQLVVDNCFCTPALQQPLKHGADLVIHSATKYLDGQGRCVGGAIVGSEDQVGGEIYPFLRTAGPAMSPFNAWVFLKGLETLSLRMEAHCRQAQLIAEWLQEQPAVTRVIFPGLADHPQYELAQRQQSGVGGIVSFEVRGDRAAAWQVIDSTELLSITANLGDARTTITHPATTTHGRLTPDQRQQAGINESLLRVSVGLETITDIQVDLTRGLGRI